jgi:CubicO group peptidase (beta-lactamase class C family)
MLPSERRQFLSPTSFGHDGAGGQVGFADPEKRVGFGYVSNALQVADDTRAPSIIDALRDVMSA